MSNCLNPPAAATPPQIVAAGKYVYVVDQYGFTKVLARPASGRCVLCFDGDDIYFVNGSDALPFTLSQIPYKGIDFSFNGLMVRNEAGRFFAFVNETGPEKVLKSSGGMIFWADPSTNTGSADVPMTGNGVLVKGIATDPAWLAENGLLYIDNAGVANSVPNGAAGRVLTMVGGEPVWSQLPSGSIASGGSGTALGSVFGRNTDAATVNIKVGSFTLTNGVEGEEITVANVNVSAALSAALGDGGLDVGAESANTWYYFYIMSDGTDVRGMISTNPVEPDLSNTAMTHWGLASVFRNNGSSTIVDFRQRGRRFQHAPIVATNQFTSQIWTSGFAAISVSVVLNTILPPNVQTVSGLLGGSDTANATTTRIRAVASNVNGIGYQIVSTTQQTAAFDGWQGGVGSFLDLIIDDATSPAIYTMSNTAETKSRLAITGYTI